MSQKVLSLLHEKSPYEGFPEDRVSYDPQGWGSDHPVFEREITRLKPSLIVEVGTWKGASALHMAKIARSLDIDCEIVCVDSFLGSREHWLVPRWKSELRLEHGQPQVYRQFLANVVHDGFEDVITPFSCTSSHAAKILAHHDVVSDIVYIDAGHEYRDVLYDIDLFWQIIRPGGVMIGDDFASYFPGVMRAVREFGDTISTSPEIDGDKWILRKNA
ncbi:class I SAM-dependent methyltransferase [Streptomyces sp. NPDC057963]|uniref:class I SAM-dependent methyltransferase n=1 Tax=Streptomyces sp. NPDC057963 TaxID=3346290 RepID=UPI0036E45002